MKKNYVLFVFVFIMAAVGAMATGVKSNGKSEAVAKKRPLPPILPAENEAFFGSRIQRTMTLLHTSNKKHHNLVKILFYGQSIIASPWSGAVMEQLRSRFPEADLTMENRAIGGYTAPTLQRPAVHDLYPFYPDLVVFHVYGGAYTGELEGIISNIRRYTTSFRCQVKSFNFSRKK